VAGALFKLTKGLYMIKAFDIETVPNLNLIDSLPEPEVAIGNLKDPDKIAEKIKAAKEKQVSNMALSPFYGRICSYSFFGPEIQRYHTVDEISDAAEIELINEIFDQLKNGESYNQYIITWNGMKFDFPFVFVRAMLLRIEPKCNGLSFWTKKYTHAPHCDMMQELTLWSNEHKSLNNAASSILGKKKIDIDCTKFLDMINEGKSAEIGIYNLMDSELTFNIHETAKDYLW
jgi:predicted PolB exonuclease-like 3'-5' exonuclease